MRLTRAQLFTLLAVAVPGLVLLAWFLLGVFLALASDPWYEDDRRAHAASAAGVAVQFTAFLGFGTFALLAARPSSTMGQLARRIALYLVAFVLIITGIVVLCAHLGEPAPTLRDVFLVSVPLAFACLYALARDSDPPRSRRDAALFVGRWTIAWLALCALGLPILIGIHEVGAGVVVRVLCLFVLGFVALTIFLLVVNLLLAGLSGLRGGRGSTMLVSQFFRMARNPMTREEAELEWAAMRRIPQGGTLIEGWHRSSSSVLRLHCEGADGRRYVLLGNLPKGPWMHRLVGLLVYSFTSTWPARKTKRGVGLTVQLESDLTPLTDGALETELTRLGDGATGGLPAQGWSCSDSPGLRLDLIDANGRDFLVLVNPADEWETLWTAGLFLGFARVPTLASDKMGPSWSLPSATSSNPPPRTQPSSP